MNSKFVFTAVAAAGFAFPHGFHMSMINLLSPAMHEWFQVVDYNDRDSWGISDHTLMIGTVILSLPFGGIVGGALVAYAAEKLGRRSTMVISVAPLVVSLILMAAAKFVESVTLLLLGRVFMGVSVGLNGGACPMYLVEIAPVCLRGIAGSMYYCEVTIAVVCGFILSQPSVFGTMDNWPWIYVVSAIPTVVHLLMIFRCPESPEYLFITKQDETGADDALSWLRNTWDIDDEIDDLREEATHLQQFTPIKCETLCDEQVFRSPFIISTVIMVGQQLSGVDAILCFTLRSWLIFQYTIDTIVSLTIGLGFTALIASLIGVFLVEYVGRKTLLMLSFGGMTLISLVLCLMIVFRLTASNVTPTSNRPWDIYMGLMFTYVLMHGLGAGNVSWFVTSELCNHAIRPKAAAWTTAFSWATYSVICLLHLSFSSVAKVSFVMFYFVVDAAMVVFVALTMRETQNEPDLNILEMFYD